MRTFNRTLFVHLFLTCGFVGLIMLLRRLDMGAYFKIQQTLDVIAQFNRDGSIIPLKIRLYDEDGELQSYKVKSVRQRYVSSTKAPSDYHIIIFDCKINAFGHDKIVSISYSYADRLWKILDEPLV